MADRVDKGAACIDEIAPWPAGVAVPRLACAPLQGEIAGPAAARILEHLAPPGPVIVGIDPASPRGDFSAYSIMNDRGVVLAAGELERGADAIVTLEGEAFRLVDQVAGNRAARRKRWRELRRGRR